MKLTKQHVGVCGLSLHQGSTESRKRLEQKWIFSNRLSVILMVSTNAFNSTNYLVFHVTRHQPLAPLSLYKPHTTHNSLIRSDEGLTLETSASKSLYGDQFTLSTHRWSKLSRRGSYSGFFFTSMRTLSET